MPRTVSPRQWVLSGRLCGDTLPLDEVTAILQGTAMRTFKMKLLSCASVAVLASSVAAGAAWAGSAKVDVTDKTFDVAGGMLAYTEFELSGEPTAEALGLDLDILDPVAIDQPTAFDYAAGIESYEYSEEAMYAVNYQSKMGPHIVNGPLNATRGGTMESLGKRVMELSASVGYPVEELPLNFYPITFPYGKGMPEFATAPDTSEVGRDEVTLLSADGKESKQATVIPAFFRDFASMAWREEGMDKAFSPAAVGAEMLKDVMWAQDFLGGMHVKESDEEVEAENSSMDQDGVHALGVSAADGVNGVLLTEITWDKLLMLRDSLAYDGKTVGAKLTAAYDPAKGPIWFPTRVEVTEAEKNGVKSVGGLKVADAASTLRDTWMLLWPLSEVYAFTDQRDVHKAQNPAFMAVFDGAPFAAAPAANRNLDMADDVAADDAFSAVSVLSNALFKNLDALHFNNAEGTFVDRWDGKAGNTVTTYDAAYALAALQIFQRSQDALPVGYASGDGGDSVETARGKRALVMITKQADFIVGKLVGKDGLVADSYTIGKGASAERSMATQFATIRGLAAAFKATGNEGYRTAARNIYLAVEAKMYDKALGTFADQPGKPTVHTPWTEAAISAGLRELMLTLRNAEGEKEPLLDLANLTERYTSWFRAVINGGMQMAEWMGDTGENILVGQKPGDSDGDGVPSVPAAGVAMVMAGKATVSVAK